VHSPAKVVILLVAGYALLCLAWALGNPPFASADEDSHYLRAVGLAGGDLVGDKVNYPPKGLTPVQLDWVNQASRSIRVPAGLASDGFGCNAFHPNTSAGCARDWVPNPEPVQRVSAVGTYQPTFYLLPGFVARLAPDATMANHLGRIANAITCLLLLALAAVSLCRKDRPFLSLVGLMLAVTPMVVFFMASLNTSGPEIAAALALGAALLRLARDHERPARWVWAAVGLSAGTLALSRSIGPVFVALVGLIFIGWVGPGAFARLVRSAPRPSMLVLAAIGLTAGANRWWEARYGPHVSLPSGDAWPEVVGSLTDVPRWFGQQVGVFQYLDTPMQPGAYWAWSGGLLLLIALGLLIGSWRQRAVLIAAACLTITLMVALNVMIFRPIGFYVQGRHALALAVLVPLLAGEALSSRSDWPTWAVRSMAIVFGGIVGTVHCLGWYANARRSGVGMRGPWLFFSSAQWSPPGGWLCWWLVVLTGAALMLCAALLGTSLRQPAKVPLPD
jgi:hypothetical protein